MRPTCRIRICKASWIEAEPRLHESDKDSLFRFSRKAVGIGQDLLPPLAELLPLDAPLSAVSPAIVDICVWWLMTNYRKKIQTTS